MRVLFVAAVGAALFSSGYVFNEVAKKLDLSPINEARANILWTYNGLIKDEDFNRAVKHIVSFNCRIWDPKKQLESVKKMNERLNRQHKGRTYDSYYYTIRCI